MMVAKDVEQVWITYYNTDDPRSKKFKFDGAEWKVDVDGLPVGDYYFYITYFFEDREPLDFEIRKMTICNAKSK